MSRCTRIERESICRSNAMTWELKLTQEGSRWMVLMRFWKKEGHELWKTENNIWTYQDGCREIKKMIYKDRMEWKV